MTDHPGWDQRIATWPWGNRRWGLRAALVAGVLQIAGETAAFHGEHANSAQRPLDLFGYFLLAAGPALLLVRPRAQRATLIGILAITILFYLMGYPNGPAFVALFVALFTTVMCGHRLFAWVAASSGLAIYAVSAEVIGETWRAGPLEYLFVTAWLLVALILSEAARARRDRWAASMQSRRDEGLRRASEERVQVARELHDVLAHNISLINVRAGVALHLIEERPEEVRAALSAIKEASKEALGELRSVLGVLRNDRNGAPLAPTPGLDQIPRLVADISDAGLVVSTRIGGDQRTLPKAQDLAAFRIVQESLTNVRRHSQSKTATIDIMFNDAELVVQIDDDGPSTQGNTTTSGDGVRGMRERATTLGGTLDAKPRSDGGFRVTARLPIGDTE